MLLFPMNGPTFLEYGSPFFYEGGAFGLSTPSQSEFNTLKFKATNPDGSSFKIKRLIAGVITLGLSEILKKTAGFALTTSGELSKESRKNALRDFKEENPEYSAIADKLKIKTSDGAKLDGMIIKPGKNATGPSEQTYVVWLNGLGQSYESKLNFAVEYANVANANIVLFNYRGAGDSGGIASGSKDLKRDVAAIIEFLMKKLNVSQKNIVIHGFSLGGALGLLMAARYDFIRDISDRSFAVLSKTAKNIVREYTKDYIGDTAGGVLGSISAELIKILGFELDVRKAFEVQEESRLIAHGLDDRLLVICHEEDNLIKDEDSLKKYLFGSEMAPLISRQAIVLRRKDLIVNKDYFYSHIGKNKNLIQKYRMERKEDQSDLDYAHFLRDTVNRKLGILTESPTEQLKDQGVDLALLPSEIKALKKLKNVLYKIGLPHDPQHNLSITAFTQIDEIYKFIKPS